MKKLLPKIEYLQGLIKRFWLMMLVASVVGGLLGGIISRISYQPEYQMTQAFTIEVKNHPDANDAGVSETQLSKTIPALLCSEAFMDHMAPIIKNAGASGKFKVTSLEASNIFYLTCVARSNNDAQIIINQIAEHYSDLADRVVGESEMKFLAPPSYSKIPINTPHYTISAVVGMLIGGIMIFAVLILMALISDTVTSADEIESEINTKCLSTVDKIYTKRRSRKEDTPSRVALVSDERADFDFKKSISTLSANVNEECKENGHKAILVTSTVSGEGKSTIALNLACDLADKGKKVVIVDCDMRSPSIAEYIGLNAIGTALSDAIKAGDYASCVTETPIANLCFCGNTGDTSLGFDDITNDAMKDTVAMLKSKFDYVILDTAPVGFLGDAISICGDADCFLYVIGYNGAHKSSIMRCIATLNEVNKNMIGFVLNNR